MLKLKGRKLYREDGSEYAEIYGSRECYLMRPTYKADFADGRRLDKNWRSFKEAVREVRATYDGNR